MVWVAGLERILSKRSQKYPKIAENRFFADWLRTGLRIGRMFLLIIFTNHILACTWYGGARLVCYWPTVHHSLNHSLHHLNGGILGILLRGSFTGGFFRRMTLEGIL